MYKRTKQGWLKHLDFIIWDEISLQLAFVLAYLIRINLSLPYAQESYRRLAIIYIVLDFCVAALFNTMHNVLKRGLYKEFMGTLMHVSIVLVTVALFLFSTQRGDTYSRILVFLTTLFHLLLGYGLRLAWKQVILGIGMNRVKATMILVADEKNVEEIVSHVSPVDDFEIKGLVLINRKAMAGEEICGLKVVANLSNAADYICREWVDRVFVYPAELNDIDVEESLVYESVEGLINDTYTEFSGKEYEAVAGEDGTDDDSKEATVGTLIEQCRQMSVPVHIRLPISNIGQKCIVEKISGYNVLTTTTNYASRSQLMTKRLLDILGGLVGSLIALIIMAIVGPKIKKESPGPILFKQTRIGRNGKKFKIYKIRSMYMDAEERKEELLNENRSEDGMMFKMDWDPRIIGNKIVDGKQVTGIGEFIRRNSLDEFPQFFNVLRNQMSLVGTRPPTVDEWEKYKYHHRARLAFKPGITGIWQVSGRSRITDFEEVVRLDTEYINNWSIGLDIRILLRTIKVVFNRDGAM